MGLSRCHGFGAHAQISRDSSDNTSNFFIALTVEANPLRHRIKPRFNSKANCMPQSPRNPYEIEITWFLVRYRQNKRGFSPRENEHYCSVAAKFRQRFSMPGFISQVYDYPRKTLHDTVKKVAISGLRCYHKTDFAGGAHFRGGVGECIVPFV